MQKKPSPTKQLWSPTRTSIQLIPGDVPRSLTYNRIVNRERTQRLLPSDGATRTTKHTGMVPLPYRTPTRQRAHTPQHVPALKRTHVSHHRTSRLLFPQRYSETFVLNTEILRPGSVPMALHSLEGSCPLVPIGPARHTRLIFNGCRQDLRKDCLCTQLSYLTTLRPKYRTSGLCLLNSTSRT
jgi:hypothetical protein